MDRQGFLSSLPFLIPCPSGAWPPRPSSSSNNSGMKEPSTKMETLLVPANTTYKFKLSLEPLNTSGHGDVIQPSFFGRTENFYGKKGFDPAMADIQVAVESSLGTTVMTTTTTTATNDGSSQDDTSVLQGRVLFVGNTTTQQSPASLRSTPRHHPRATPSTRLFESWPLFLHVRVDKEGVFQVDPKQLVSTELVLHDQSNNNNLPPCLLLTFSTCLWRIFPLHTPSPTKPVSSDSDNTPRDEWKQAAVESLQTLEKSLHQLLQSGTSTAAWSPCTSSSLSNNETGQRDIHTSSSSSASHHNHKKFKGMPKHTDVSLQDHNTVRKVRRQRDALNRSILGLRSMEVVLESPASSFLHNNNRGNNNNNDTCADSLDAAQTQVQNTRQQQQQQQQQSLVPLLAGITEDLSAAFGNNHDKQEALQAYRRKLDDHRDMEQLLDAFFPPSAMASGGSRRRRSRSRGRTNTEVVAQATKPAEEVIPAVQQLLTKQRALMKERGSLLALPTRG